MYGHFLHNELQIKSLLENKFNATKKKKIKKIVLSSNQTLIWEALEKIGENNSIKGFGKLFNSN